MHDILELPDQQGNYASAVAYGFTEENSMALGGSPRSNSASASNISTDKRRKDAFRVEEPLLPSSQPATVVRRPTSVSFPEVALEFVPDPPNDSSEADRTFFHDVIVQIATEEERKLENEQLSHVDTEGRIPIPDILPYHPLVPWETSKPDRIEQQLIDYLDSLQRWHGASKIDRTLSWTAFPVNLGRVAIVETVDDPRYLTDVLADMDLNDVISSESLLWKPAGLRILDDMAEEEDKLEAVAYPIEDGIKDLSSAVLKRRIETEHGRLSEPVQKRHHVEPLEPPSAYLPPSVSRPSCSVELLGSRHSSPLNRKMRLDKLEAREEVSILSPSMSRFLQTRNISWPLAPNTENRPLPSPPMDVSGESNTRTELLEIGRPSPRPPTPSIATVRPAKPFIMSLNLIMTHRPLLRDIKSRYPSAQLIERDFASASDGAFRNADIILSPSTGLVFSTLQRIKQKPLPGQAATTGIKERLVALSTSHERLICLIAEGSNENNVHNIDDHDCDSLAGLSAFATTLEADVQIIYVPGGTPELAAWVVSCMAQHCVSSNAHLLATETVVSSAVPRYRIVVLTDD